jgi:AraC-like DNA-binding protein
MYRLENTNYPCSNFRKVSGSCGKVVFSSVKEWYNSAVFRDISIKYTLKGTEYFYDKEGNQYKVDQGRFLLGRFDQNSGECRVNSRSSFVDAISMYFNPEILDDIYTSITLKKHLDPCEFYVDQLKNPHFFNGIFSARHTMLYEELNKIADWHYVYDQKLPPNLLDEYLIETAEKIILLQYDIHQSMSNFRFEKLSTRREMMKRLLNTKSFLDDCFMENPSLDDIAKIATLSKYHLLRNFKQAFRETPFEYLLKKRLLHARDELINSKESINSIATDCAFSDLASFSKAFKNKFGLSPSVYRKTVS